MLSVSDLRQGDGDRGPAPVPPPWHPHGHVQTLYLQERHLPSPRKSHVVLFLHLPLYSLIVIQLLYSDVYVFHYNENASNDF